MNRIHNKSLLLVMVLGVVLMLAACKSQEEYLPSYYTKEEVKSLYFENNVLFEEVVQIVSSNERFFEEGCINEHTHADIISPNDEALECFDDAERRKIEEFFQLKPYMILCDQDRRFVKITFYGADGQDAYSFLFWTQVGANSEAELEEYKEYLSQDYILKDAADKVVFYWHK